jgi:hypothetical protein
MDIFNSVKSSPFDRQFHLGEEEKITRPVIWEVGLTVVFVAANNCRITSDK